MIQLQVTTAMLQTSYSRCATTSATTSPHQHGKSHETSPRQSPTMKVSYKFIRRFTKVLTLALSHRLRCCTSATAGPLLAPIPRDESLRPKTDSGRHRLQSRSRIARPLSPHPARARQPDTRNCRGAQAHFTPVRNIQRYKFATYSEESRCRPEYRRAGRDCPARPS